MKKGESDLSIRILKSGLSTVNFRAFLVGKRATLTQKGGNENIYAETDDRLEFAQSLKDQHPDVVKVVKKFNRWHHHVDYRPFEGNNLIKKSGIEIPRGVKEYGIIADAYYKAANKVGIKGYQMQAITWVAWRRQHNIAR